MNIELRSVIPTQPSPRRAPCGIKLCRTAERNFDSTHPGLRPPLPGGDLFISEVIDQVPLPGGAGVSSPQANFHPQKSLGNCPSGRSAVGPGSYQSVGHSSSKRIRGESRYNTSHARPGNEIKHRIRKVLNSMFSVRCWIFCSLKSVGLSSHFLPQAAMLLQVIRGFPSLSLVR